MREEGTRVGAIFSMNTETIKLLGYGVYEGVFTPGKIENVPLPAGFVGETISSERLTNPLLKLDNGEYVWGCECWWGSEEGVKKVIKEKTMLGAKVIKVKMSDLR